MWPHTSTQGKQDGADQRPGKRRSQPSAPDPAGSDAVRQLRRPAAVRAANSRSQPQRDRASSSHLGPSHRAAQPAGLAHRHPPNLSDRKSRRLTTHHPARVPGPESPVRQHCRRRPTIRNQRHIDSFGPAIQDGHQQTRPIPIGGSGCTVTPWLSRSASAPLMSSEWSGSAGRDGSGRCSWRVNRQLSRRCGRVRSRRTPPPG